MIESKRYIAVPPGATILELLEDRGIRQKEFAERMEMSGKDVMGLIGGDIVLTQQTAQKLEQVLSVPASFWEKLEANYREKRVLVENENTLEKKKGFS